MTQLRSLVALSLCLALSGCGRTTSGPAPTTGGDGGMPDTDAALPSGDAAPEVPEYPFTLIGRPGVLFVRRGEQAALGVRVERTEGFDAPVSMALEGLGEGVGYTVTYGEDGDPEIVISVETSAAPGERLATVRAWAGELGVQMRVPVAIPDEAGTLDASFGDHGEIAVPGGVEEIAVDYAGRIYTAATDVPGVLVRVARFERNGTPDPEWNAQPIVLHPEGDDGSGDVVAIALLPERGALVLAQYDREGERYPLLLELAPDGAQRRVLSIAPGEQAKGLVLARGRAVVVTAARAGDDTPIARARSYDAADLTAAPLTRDVPSLVPLHLERDPVDRALLLGRDPDGGTGVVMRLSPSLEIDGFAGGRYELAGFAPSDIGFRADGSMVVVGRDTSAAVSRPMAVALDLLGQPVDVFGASGVMHYDGIEGMFSLTDTAGDGRVIASGYRTPGELLLERITPGGALDPNFVPTGLGSTVAASALEVLDDARFLVSFPTEEGTRIVRAWR